MNKVNTTKMAELTWCSPKGKFSGAGKEISETLGRKPESTDLNERHPFDVEILRIPPGKAPYSYHSHSAHCEFYHVISGSVVVRHTEQTEHMLKWFAEEPYAAIRSGVEDMLKQQVADSRLTTFTVLSEPQWLTGAVPSDADANKAILVRSAVAFEFGLSVESQGQSHRLSGVYTWASGHQVQPG